MKFIYPQSILTPRLPDEMFQDEATAFLEAGHNVALIDSQRLSESTSKIKPPIDADVVVAYRGWMLSPTEYDNFILSVKATGGTPLTSTDQYLTTHYLPNWYKVIADLTPETVILPLDADWASDLANLGWSKFFVKDYVKSLKTSVGSLIERPEEIHTVAAEMEKYRGTIEGGLCIRRVEDFLPETEQRYFVLNNKPFSADPQAMIPDIVFKCGERIDSKFFSVDVIRRLDGQLRIVEIGDGQVSDLVGWTVERFVDIWKEMI